MSSNSSILLVVVIAGKTLRTTNTSSVQPGKYPFLKVLNFLFNLTLSPTLKAGGFFLKIHILAVQIVPNFFGIEHSDFGGSHANTSMIRVIILIHEFR